MEDATVSETPAGQDERRERWQALHDLEEWLERPMVVLSCVWLALLIVEMTHGLPRWLDILGLVIWGIFVLDFALRIALAPDRGRFLRTEWLTAISLLVPALRIFRFARVLRSLRAVRGLRLVKVVGSANRGVRALGRSFSRRGAGYVLAIVVVVTAAGAAGMLAFERDVPGSPITGYGAAVWWTFMVMTTMGTDYFPRTPEGRALCALLAVFAFAIFGYVTAALATFFIGRDAESAEAEVAGQASVEAVLAEVRQLRAELRAGR
jgi:voltage-gated potassium channel